MSAIRSNDPKDRQTQSLDAARAQQQQQQEAAHAAGASASGGDKPDALDAAKGGFKPQFTRELETKAAAGQKPGDGEDPAQQRAREDAQTQKVADILRDQLQQKRV